MTTDDTTHPLKCGTRIRSIQGECDEGDNGPRSTGPNATGRVMTAKHYPGQGWTYGVGFDSGVFVFIDESDGLDDPSKYVIQKDR